MALRMTLGHCSSHTLWSYLRPATKSATALRATESACALASIKSELMSSLVALTRLGARLTCRTRSEYFGRWRDSSRPMTFFVQAEDGIRDTSAHVLVISPKDSRKDVSTTKLFRLRADGLLQLSPVYVFTLDEQSPLAARSPDTRTQRPEEVRRLRRRRHLLRAEQDVASADVCAVRPCVGVLVRFQDSAREIDPGEYAARSGV